MPNFANLMPFQPYQTGEGVWIGISVIHFSVCPCVVCLSWVNFLWLFERRTSSWVLWKCYYFQRSRGNVPRLYGANFVNSSSSCFWTSIMTKRSKVRVAQNTYIFTNNFRKPLLNVLRGMWWDPDKFESIGSFSCSAHSSWKISELLKK